MRPETSDQRSPAKRWCGVVFVSCLTSLVSCLTTGCVYRALTIKTDPSGASVYVNDTLLEDKTPLTYDFLWYGGYRVAIRKEGFEQLDDHKFLRCPPYLWMPLDLVMELLPIKFYDRREWSYTLKPKEELPVPTPPAITNPKAERPAAHP